VRYQFIDDHRREYPTRRLCRVLEVSASGYYAWRKRLPSAREMANRALVERIARVQVQARHTYGSPRVHAELCAQGESCGRNRVARLMRQYSLGARYRKGLKRTTRVNQAVAAAPNLLGGKFEAEEPNRIWLADITYVATAKGWLYLAAVVDLYTRRVMGWAMDRWMTTELTRSALRMALKQTPFTGHLIHHSDRGSQYTATAYRMDLAACGIDCSLSAAGNCYDNAPMESFFATLKGELVHHRRYQTRAEARTDIFSYIEGFYNRRRRHSSLGYLSPEEFERAFYQRQQGLSPCP
jgi:putative transposase